MILWMSLMCIICHYTPMTRMDSTPRSETVSEMSIIYVVIILSFNFVATCILH